MKTCVPLPPLGSDAPFYTLELTPAAMWSKVIGRGKTLRLTNLDGRANVGMLLYNALEKEERYNMPDTLKGQHIFYLAAPYCLHSDMGRLLASITAATGGWHDTVCGCSNADLIKRKYGDKNYQQARNDCYKDARNCFLIELAKWGLGPRDLVPNINWFSEVRSSEDGSLRYIPEASPAGSYVDLRFELDTLVVLNSCQHPLDPNPNYEPGKVKLEVFHTVPPAMDDPSLTVRPENRRAYENTVAYNKLRF